MVEKLDVTVTISTTGAGGNLSHHFAVCREGKWGNLPSG
jgi:hypothetical protein